MDQQEWHSQRGCWVVLMSVIYSSHNHNNYTRILQYILMMVSESVFQQKMNLQVHILSPFMQQIDQQVK